MQPDLSHQGACSALLPSQPSPTPGEGAAPRAPGKQAGKCVTGTQPKQPHVTPANAPISSRAHFALHMPPWFRLGRGGALFTRAPGTPARWAAQVAGVVPSHLRTS